MNGLWVIFALAASAGQTARNAMPRALTGRLGTAAATHVRFPFGLPFARIMLAVAAGFAISSSARRPACARQPASRW